MYVTGSGSTAVTAAFQILGDLVRQAVTFFLWVVMAALVAAGSWYCGYAAREAWAGLGRSRTSGDDPDVAFDDVVPDDVVLDADDDAALHREAERGIHEIELYLAAAGSHPEGRRHLRRERRRRENPRN